MTCKILVADRKTVVKRLQDITGVKPTYSRVPRCAYIVEGIAVEKDGTVTTEEGADLTVLQMLADAGLIEMTETFQPEPVITPFPEETPVVESEPVGLTPKEGTPVEEYEPQPVAEEPFVDSLPEETTEEESELTELPITVNHSEKAENPEKPREVPIIERHSRTLVFTFPLDAHTADSLKNLVFTIYSRGALLSKATGGDFYASHELVEHLQSGCIMKKEDVIELINEAGSSHLRGIRITDGTVVFDGFPTTMNTVVFGAWTVLVAAINNTAKTQKHIRPKITDDPNEKYTFRTWMVRLGMNGPELKKERAVLLRDLDGDTAFRTPQPAERWRERRASRPISTV